MGPSNVGKTSWLKNARCNDFPERTQVTPWSNRFSDITLSFDTGSPRCFRVQDLPGSSSCIVFKAALQQKHALVLMSEINRGGLQSFKDRTMKEILDLKRSEFLQGRTPVCLVFTKADRVLTDEGLRRNLLVIDEIEKELGGAGFIKLQKFYVSSRVDGNYVLDEKYHLVGDENDFGAKAPLVWLAENLFKDGKEKKVTRIEGELFYEVGDGRRVIDEEDEFNVGSDSD